MLQEPLFSHDSESDRIHVNPIDSEESIKYLPLKPPTGQNFDWNSNRPKLIFIEDSQASHTQNTSRADNDKMINKSEQNLRDT